MSEEITERTTILKLLMQGQTQLEKTMNALREGQGATQQDIGKLVTELAVVRKEREFNDRQGADLKVSVDRMVNKLDEHIQADGTRWIQFQSEMDGRLDKAMDVAEAAMKAATDAQKVVTDIQANGTRLSRRHEEILQTGKTVLGNGRLVYLVLLLVALLGGGPGAAKIAQEAIHLMSPTPASASSK